MFDKTCAVCGGGVCEPECAACRRLTELITEWEYGYEKGIDAARKAVAAVEYRPTNPETMIRSMVFEAIDALREDSETPPPLPPSAGVPERRWT